MRTRVDCIPCFARQTLEASRDLGFSGEDAEGIMRETLSLLLDLDWSLPPPLLGREIHRAIREMTGDPDPYLRRKKEATEAALSLLPEIEARVAAAEDPFAAAVKVATAGNIIDLGARPGEEIDVEKAFRDSLDAALDPAPLARLRRAVEEAGSVLFLADNAGEIVFDRPLLERIGPDKAVVAVRGGPAINDATLEDAERSGLAERFRVVSNGADVPGTYLPACSREFAGLFERADLVVAKGQGNYETLSDAKRRIFFLFLAKCPLVAGDAGVPVGAFVIHEIP